MCDKACCTNTTRHAIILLSILSLLLLINAPSLNPRPPSKEVAGPSGSGGGDAPPCLPCATCTHNMFTSFLYGVLFTSIFVMTIIATNHIPAHTNTHHTAGPPLPWGGPATWSVLMGTTEADHLGSRDDGAGSSGGGGGEGVGDALLRTFPTFAYSSRWKSKMGKGESKCVICQRKFREGEMLRWLPECDHVFHLSCIDKWLASHKSCPCCRAQLQVLSNEIYDEDFEFPF